jgi:hypothetical protein
MNKTKTTELKERMQLKRLLDAVLELWNEKYGATDALRLQRLDVYEDDYNDY